MRIAIAIATVGRPALVAATVRRLARQTRPPDRLLVVAADPHDLPPEGLAPPAQAAFAPRGSCAQRNAAIARLAGDADILVFLDDDFFPAADFLEGVARLFDDATIVAASGALLADGAMGPGVAPQEADALIARYEQTPRPPLVLTDDTGTYGCNMVVRLAAAPQARFDENLPLYGWLEDTDYSAQFERVGRVVRTNAFAGVHLGAKTGRSSGVRLGYSQIANPLYLVRKGVLDPRRAWAMASRNMLANLVKSAAPEAWIDRRGRLKGNALALLDIARGASDPRRVLDL